MLLTCTELLTNTACIRLRSVEIRHHGNTSCRRKETTLDLSRISHSFILTLKGHPACFVLMCNSGVENLLKIVKTQLKSLICNGSCRTFTHLSTSEIGERVVSSSYESSLCFGYPDFKRSFESSPSRDTSKLVDFTSCVLNDDNQIRSSMPEMDQR